jgi:hypothetical protein
MAGKAGIGQLAYLPGADAAGPCRWAVRFGADGWAASRAAALAALARAWQSAK